MKLFVGRLPQKVTQRHIRECFEDFGEVLEVFLIDSQAMSNVGCAFVRMATLEQAKLAMAELHEQRVLLPEFRELGPMQVAFAKGEATRLGLTESEETLPSFREARQKVAEHKEKRRFFEAIQQQQSSMWKQLEHPSSNGAVQQQQNSLPPSPSGTMADLVGLIKDGQRRGGQAFKQRWRGYCDQGWAGVYDYDPAHHRYETLLQFVSLIVPQYGHEPWLKARLRALPAAFVQRPGMWPGMVPPVLMPPPSGAPCGMVPGLPLMVPCSGPLHMPPMFPIPPPPLGAPWPRPAAPEQAQSRLGLGTEVVDVEPCIETDQTSIGADIVAPTDDSGSAAPLMLRKLQDYTDVDALSIDSG